MAYTLRRDATRRDATRRDATRRDATRRTTRRDATRRDATRRDATRHDTTRHDTTRHDTTRHDTIFQDSCATIWAWFDFVLAGANTECHPHATTGYAYEYGFMLFDLYIVMSLTLCNCKSVQESSKGKV